MKNLEIRFNLENVIFVVFRLRQLGSEMQAHKLKIFVVLFLVKLENQTTS